MENTYLPMNVFHDFFWFLNLLSLPIFVFSNNFTLFTDPVDMEVKNAKAAMLSNFEALSLLNEIQKGHGKQKKMHTNLATVSYEIVQYLENTACAKQTPEVIANFMKAIEEYKLTKAEKLQFVNLRPATAVEIQLIVEESEERLTEAQIYQLLQLVADLLPSHEEDEEQAEGENMDNDPDPDYNPHD